MNATVHSVIDPENDKTTVTWYVPGKDVKINNVLKSRTITVPTRSTPKATYANGGGQLKPVGKCLGCNFL
ncbi:hypothetical protein [Candidatus Marithrix sp. Canyon 246]|uniref:hypothetical protein n=1 Tax=Candidatus Marithrix sp. Canyon 246 TaxID=1827136 RepID=UPI00084A13FA|nr:hypothetical protein [Candidatus Marithrix sp. Canyon 246]